LYHRLITTQNHLSEWYSNKLKYSSLIEEDFFIRETITKNFEDYLSIAKIQINRIDQNIENKEYVNITINALFPATVNEIVTLGLLSQKKIPKRITKYDKIKVNKILKELEISDLQEKMLSELSGGQQQKVLLARALVSNPEILIFDEPSTALDPNARESFFNLVQKLNKENGIAIILITHDTGYIGSYANKLMYLDHELKYFGEIEGFCRTDKENHSFERNSKHIIWHQHN
jgi:zinc transport system ATP-binding protein